MFGHEDPSDNVGCMNDDAHYEDVEHSNNSDCEDDAQEDDVDGNNNDGEDKIIGGEEDVPMIKKPNRKSRKAKGPNLRVVNDVPLNGSYLGRIKYKITS